MWLLLYLGLFFLKLNNLNVHTCWQPAAVPYYSLNSQPGIRNHYILKTKFAEAYEVMYFFVACLHVATVFSC